MDKALLRKQMRALRRDLPGDVRARETTAVTREALALVGNAPVFVFLGVRAELQTGALIQALLARGPVAIPRITGRSRMEAARYQEPLVDGPVGIPTSEGPVIDVAFALLPGLAFDRDGGRLGYGGAYYDTWLAKHPHVHAIGLGFGCQLVDQVPMEPHDHRLDAVICGEHPVIRILQRGTGKS